MSTEKLMSFDEIIFVFKFCLRFIGIMTNTFIDRRLVLIYFISSGLLDCSMFVGDLIVKRAEIGIDVIYEVSVTVGLNARYYVLLSKSREFNRLMKECAKLWNYCNSIESQSLVIKFERKIRKIFWMIFANIAIVLNVLYSLNAVNVSYWSRENDNATKILPFRWFGAEDVESSWLGYKVTFALQILVIYNAGLVSATVDSVLPLLMVICCGYFQVLCQKIKNIDVKLSDDPTFADCELIECSKFHQRILNLCYRVEKLGRPMFLIQLTTSGYILGLVAIKLASSDPDKYKHLPSLFSLLAHIFICQWAPDLLMDQSKDVSTAAYSVSCTFMNRPSAKHVAIMIIRAQQPLIMTAGGIIILSLQNFGKMCSSAVSVFIAMRNLMN